MLRPAIKRPSRRRVRTFRTGGTLVGLIPVGIKRTRRRRRPNLLKIFAPVTAGAAALAVIVRRRRGGEPAPDSWASSATAAPSPSDLPTAATSTGGSDAGSPMESASATEPAAPVSPVAPPSGGEDALPAESPATESPTPQPEAGAATDTGRKKAASTKKEDAAAAATEVPPASAGETPASTEAGQGGAS